VAVLWPRLRQVGGASLDMGQRRQRRIPARNRIEPPASLVRLAPPGDLDRLAGLGEDRLARRGNEVVIEERQRVVAGVALGPDEPCAGVDGQPLARQQFTDAPIVGHLRKGSRVGAAASAPARPAVVG
jgi:hypothetical protein